MMQFKSCDQLRQNKELVTTDKDHQLRVGWIAMQVGNIVHVGYEENVPLTGRIIGPLAPWRCALGDSESCACKHQNKWRKLKRDFHLRILSVI